VEAQAAGQKPVDPTELVRIGPPCRHGLILGVITTSTIEQIQIKHSRLIIRVASVRYDDIIIGFGHLNYYKAILYSLKLCLGIDFHDLSSTAWVLMCLHVWTQKWIDPFRCLSLTESKAEESVRTFASLITTAGDHLAFVA
jgi:hypothetical protein